MTGAERVARHRERKRAEAITRERNASYKRTWREAQRRANAELPEPKADLVDYVSELVITQGEGEGAAFEVLDWQREFIRKVEATAGGELGLSVAAGGGKTTLLGAIAAAGVYGPLARPRADVIVVAGSFGQALLTFDAAHSFLQPLIEADPRRFRVNRSETTALITDRKTGATLKAREATPGTLHGSAPALVLADEPAQWKPTQRDKIYSALRSRLGKIPGARLLAIGTRSDDATHWFTRLLSRSGVTYQADPEGDWTDPAQWHAANPSLPHFPALLAVYKRECAEAEADPSLLPEFRALRLNLGTADHAISVLIEAATWQRCECDILPAASGPTIWGVDLSGGDALAAVACYWPTTGRLEALAAFPAIPDLAERGRTDGADYARMRSEGDLLVLGRRVVPVPGLVAAALERWGRPARFVADHHQERELREALEAADFPAASLTTTGMGWTDSPGRIRDFRRQIGAGKVWARPRLLIRQAMANARTVSDSMASEKVIKGGASGRKRTARDDVAIAALLAVSEGARMAGTGRARRRRHYVA